MLTAPRTVTNRLQICVRFGMPKIRGRP